MIKKIYILLLTVLGMGVISSCSDYLNSEKYFKDRLTLEKTFESKDHVEEWLAYAFSFIKNENYEVTTKGPSENSFCFSDDMYYGDRDKTIDATKNELSYNMFKLGEYDENTYNVGAWGACYKGIFQASVFIHNVDRCQEMADWEKCINSFRVELDCDIYITGSNAKLLSGELATYLAGRYVEFVIYPFSFREFMELYHTVYEGADERQCFTKYLTLGGMPYLSNLRYDDASSRQYLRDLFNSVELKDIIKRNNIRDVDMLERIIAYITSNIGTTFSSTAISKYLKSEGRSVSPETVLNYIKACTDAFLFYQVKRQDLQGKKILTVNEKYYVADHGVREAVYGGNMKDINLVLENVVYMELLRRGYSVTVGKVSDKEIDFVCEDHGKKLYVQVSYLLASEETIQREFGAFAGVRDNFPKYVVTMDELDMSRDGIKHRNIRDFLLAEEWN